VNKPTELEDHRSILFYFLISKQRSFIKKNVGAPEYTGSIQKDANRKGKTYEKHEKKKKKKKTPTKTQPQQKSQSTPTKTQKPSATLHQKYIFLPRWYKNIKNLIMIPLCGMLRYEISFSFLFFFLLC
jgi:hypothetical protein